MSGTTTIQVSEDVIEMLKNLRSQFKEDSYNAVIRTLLSKQRQQQSLAGFLGKRLSKKELFEGLRDEEE